MSFADYMDDDEQPVKKPAVKGRFAPRANAPKREIDIGEDFGIPAPTAKKQAPKSYNHEADLESGFGGGYQNGNGNGVKLDEAEGQKLASDLIEHVRQIHDASAKIEKIIEKLGTPKDTHELRQSLKSTIERTSPIVKEAGHKVKRLSDIVGKSDQQSTGYGSSGSSLRLQLNKLKGDVKEALIRFDKITKTAAKKEKEHVIKAKQQVDAHKSQRMNGSGYQPALEEEFTNVEAVRQEDQQILLQKKKEGELLLNQIEHNESLIAERETDIKEIESSIREINDVFRELNVLVNEQGENLNLISDFVDEAGHSVKTGVKDLGTAEKYDKKGRNLLCILLILVIGIGLVVAIVLAVVLKLFVFK